MTEDVPMRHARIAEIRRQIEAGIYETEERLSVAVDALLDDLTAARPATDDGLAEPPNKPR